MVEIFVGLIFMLLFGGNDDNNRKNDNDEIIRPILLDNFHDHDFDGGDGE